MARDKERQSEKKSDDRAAKQEKINQDRKLSERRAKKAMKKIRSAQDLEDIEELDDLGLDF